LGILFQNLGPVYCIDLRVKDFIDEVVVRWIIMSFINMRIAIGDETWKAVVDYFVHTFS